MKLLLTLSLVHTENICCDVMPHGPQITVCTQKEKQTDKMRTFVCLKPPKSKSLKPEFCVKQLNVPNG